MDDLTKKVEDIRFNQAGMWIQNLENGFRAIEDQVQAFFVLGLHFVEHPISGVASEVKELYHDAGEKLAKIRAWMAAHNEAHAKKYAPVLTPPEETAAPAAETVDETAKAPEPEAA